MWKIGCRSIKCGIFSETMNSAVGKYCTEKLRRNFVDGLIQKWNCLRLCLWEFDFCTDSSAKRMICLLRKHFFVFDVTRAVWIWDEFMYYITNLNLMQNIPVNCAVLEKIYIFYVSMRAYEIFKRLFDLLIRYGYLICQMKKCNILTFFLYLWAMCKVYNYIFGKNWILHTFKVSTDARIASEWIN